MEKKVIQIDMDAFYASVEQRDHPYIKDLPVIVRAKTAGDRIEVQRREVWIYF